MELMLKTKELFRSFILDCLSLSNFFMKFQKKGFVQFIYFHNVDEQYFSQFKEIILYLKNHFVFVSHSEAIELIHHGTDKTKNYLSISFDDGFADNFEIAQLLTAMDIKACFFVCPSFIDGFESEVQKKATLREVFDQHSNIDFLGWDQVKTMIVMGHEIGSHTNSHIRIAEHSKSAIEKDLLDAQQIFKREGIRVQHFAFPYGTAKDYNNEIESILTKLNLLSNSNAVRGIHSVGAENVKMIYRDHILANWPTKHIEFFLKRNQRNSKYINQRWEV
jgi:peptidoglycan/xylan/chitin deacetylase (PgdA/CDA1 family)